MEYVLGALGACLATGFVLNASRQGIEIYDMEVVLDASQDNVFTFLGLGGEGHSGFDGIKAKLFVKSDEGRGHSAAALGGYDKDLARGQLHGQRGAHPCGNWRGGVRGRNSTA